MSDIPFPPPPAPPVPPANATLPRSPVISPSLANAVPPANAAPVRSPEDIQNERLMAFGAAMAQSNSPSFFAQLGAGFGAVNQARQKDREEALKVRELDVIERYRTAQIALQEAQLAAEQDPESPANRLRLAQAQAALMNARAAMAQAGREDRPNFVAAEDDQGLLYFDPRTNEVRRPPPGARAVGQPSREEAAQLRALQAAEQRATELTRLWAQSNPMVTDAQIQGVYESNLRRILGQRPGAQQPAAQAPATPRTIIDPTGRPITAP